MKFEIGMDGGFMGQVKKSVNENKSFGQDVCLQQVDYF